MRRLTALAAASLSLAACDAALMPTPISQPSEAAAAPPELSRESLAMAEYYSRVEAGLVAQGLLRGDGGGPDVPFSARNLVDNFVRIALFDEYTTIGGRIVARQTASQLHRWETPVRMKVTFGDSVPADQRVRDRSSIASYSARLSRITGLPIRQTTTEPNYHIYVVNEPERRALGPEIRAILPGISEAAVDAVVNMPRSTFCLVFALDPGDSGTYTHAVAVIRGEHPDLMRLSCIHEELAQGLGLSNDSPAARPSVFNDDEEFGLLTTHDELLLRMLYDDRMQAGMDAETARGVAEVIASELLDGES